MAITNAQQYKQLVNPPMEGKKRPGYRGDDAYGGGDQVAGGGDQDFGGNDPPGPDRSKISAAQEANQRAQVRAGNVRAVEDFIDRPTFGFTDAAKFNIAPLPLRFLQGLGNLFTGPTRPPVTSVGGGGGGDGIPYWAQLGFNSEAEYLASLAGQGATEPEPEEEEVRDIRKLAFRAEGGPIGGGIMDLESARQELFLGGVADAIGKGLKKVTRTVKKIAKSPIGKAALLGAVGFGIPGTSFGGLLGRSGVSGLFGTQGIGQALQLGKMKAGNLLFGIPGDMGGRVAGTGLLSKIPGGGVTAAIGGASLLAGLLTPEQEEEAQQLADDTGFSIEEARNSILARARDDYKMDFRARGFRAEGGPAEGKEPVAKKTMPLLDMGGQEMDLRAEGGFVPIGRMEKADDVPARLSKNEFVFTADAVRNAGDGDVDKGAEVMYNMMKNLESGGEVSEESQGLEGARKMFQTSQRLEEVL